VDGSHLQVTKERLSDYDHNSYPAGRSSTKRERKQATEQQRFDELGSVMGKAGGDSASAIKRKGMQSRG